MKTDISPVSIMPKRVSGPLPYICERCGAPKNGAAYYLDLKLYCSILCLYGLTPKSSSDIREQIS